MSLASSFAEVQGGSALFAQVIRADGTVEKRKMIGYSHPNPLRAAFVRLLMKLGAF